jgi:soluble lytic murein transglycosylase-like protein
MKRSILKRFVGGVLVFLAMPTITRADCFDDSAVRYSLNVDLLRSIAKNESNFNPNAIHWNTDGTHDIGIMQINSSNFVFLSRRGITEQMLYDKCLNIAVGAFFLAEAFHYYGDKWRAVGAYGAGMKADKENARMIYASRIQKLFEKATDKLGVTQVAQATPPTNVSLAVWE